MLNFKIITSNITRNKVLIYLNFLIQLFLLYNCGIIFYDEEISKLIIDNIIIIQLEILMILIFISLIPKLKKLIYILISIFITLLTLTNILYWYFFKTFFFLSLIINVQNLDGLSSSIISAFNFPIVIVFVLLISLNIYTFYTIKENDFKFHKSYVTFFFILIISKLFLFYHSYRPYISITSPRTIKNCLYNELDVFKYDTNTYVYKYGNIISNCISFINSRMIHSLSYENIKYINNKIIRTSSTNFTNSKQNIILIIIESLSSYVLEEKINGNDIMPNLSKLKDKYYYNTKMESQINLGMSSDSQFIYFTGLLPCKSGITIKDYDNNKYFGLGSILKQQLKLSTNIIIPTSKSFWNQQKACKLYGIDNLFCKSDYLIIVDKYIKNNDWLNDKQIF